MFRFVALLLTGCIATVAMLATASREPVNARSCSPSLVTFEDVVRASAGFTILADVVEVGGPVNAAPTLPPTPTWTATATDTPAPGATRTPKASATPRTRTPTALPPSATPTDTPSPYYDLTGTRATLSIVRTYAGDAPASPFVIDAERRALFERDLRAIEAGQRSTCGPSRAAAYSSGARYLVLGARASSGSTSTVMRFRVEGEDVILCDRTRMDDISCPRMRGTTYRRLFAGVEANIDRGAEWDFATIAAARMPLARFIAALDAIRSGSNITPPETGSAGLAAPRR